MKSTIFVNNCDEDEGTLRNALAITKILIKELEDKCNYNYTDIRNLIIKAIESEMSEEEIIESNKLNDQDN